MKKDYKKEALKLHEKYGGKLRIESKVPLETIDDMSIYYTPGVAEPCLKIKENPKELYRYTIKKNCIAVVTDGSAVLGLGNIGARAALPVMEGKCALFKKFGNVDAFPICIETQDVDEIVNIVKKISPVFGGINLEDISAPRCFEIEERLKRELDIFVFHDDQHGTAIVTLAGLINALKFTKKKMSDVKVVISGAGSAGIAITKLLLYQKERGLEIPRDIILCDTKGTIYDGRKEGMNLEKEKIAKLTNKEKIKGSLVDAMKESDVFIGVSVGGIVSKEMVRSMNPDPIIFAMANPDPEILPKDAYSAGAAVVATGRSDFPNQLNNVLVFPGVFRGALDAKAKEINDDMKLAAAFAIANSVKKVSKEKIIPSVFENVAKKVAGAVKKAAIISKAIKE
ncbi:MAG: NADP-dependent malic enzyme [Candidatus Altiarchaeota archaeon]